MKIHYAFLIAVVLLTTAAAPRVADTLPSQYTDAEFWSLIANFSEPGGQFPYENFVSNEVSYQDVIPDLKRMIMPGGVYLGVAPEQNFTYIAAIQPKVSFIFDFRRQNLVPTSFDSCLAQRPHSGSWVRIYRPDGPAATGS